MADGPADHGAERRKQLGAWYTPEPVVEFLVGWTRSRKAVHRWPRPRVMDPSCGDGRFLAALAAAGPLEAIGCDVDPAALAAASAAVPDGLWLAQDFFHVDPPTGLFEHLDPVDAVVGNPPYVRYQRFTGATRARALQAAAECGVQLNGLTSSWAPFVLHATRFLIGGGALALVVPAELVQTHYGLATLAGLRQLFQHLTLVAFDHKLFADASTDALLLLADGYGRPCRSLAVLHLGEAADLAGAQLEAAVPWQPDAEPFATTLLSPQEREAWRAALDAGALAPLGELGTVINGYVTGANEFFHRTPADAAAVGLPAAWLRPTARAARSLRGLSFTLDDVATLEAAGEAHHLVAPPESGAEPPAAWLAEGETAGVPSRYKCRSRSPWWRVPALAEADVLLSYMAGATPRAAVNTAGALFTNTLHGLRTAEGVDPWRVAVAWHTSAALLSLELEGRSYGGGILKLEPTEMQRVRVPGGWAIADGLADEVDRLLRQGLYDAAVQRADEAVLVDSLGWPAEQVSLLRAARARLAARRSGRPRKA